MRTLYEVSFVVCGILNVEASSEEEACKKAHDIDMSPLRNVDITLELIEGNRYSFNIDSDFSSFQIAENEDIANENASIDLSETAFPFEVTLNDYFGTYVVESYND